MANCNVLSKLLMHCMNGKSPRQIPVYILMSVVNKYLVNLLDPLNSFAGLAVVLPIAKVNTALLV